MLRHRFFFHTNTTQRLYSGLSEFGVCFLCLVVGSLIPATRLRHPRISAQRTMTLIEKQPGRYWGFAYLRPRTEKKVADVLAGHEVPVYLPLVNKARLHHGSRVVTALPMFPGYIFLAASDQERTELKKSEKEFVHIELLRTQSEEEQLIRELNALRQLEILAKSQEVLVNPGIQRGDKVVVTHGPLKGLETEVIRRDDTHNAIIVTVTILEKTVEYPVSADELKKLTA